MEILFPDVATGADHAAPKDDMAVLKGLRKTRILENAIRGVSDHRILRHREFPIGDRAVPNFVRAFPLPKQRTSGGAQKPDKRWIEVCAH